MKLIAVCLLFSYYSYSQCPNPQRNPCLWVCIGATWVYNDTCLDNDVCTEDFCVVSRTGVITCRFVNRVCNDSDYCTIDECEQRPTNPWWGCKYTHLGCCCIMSFMTAAERRANDSLWNIRSSVYRGFDWDSLISLVIKENSILRYQCKDTVEWWWLDNRDYLVWIKLYKN